MKPVIKSSTHHTQFMSQGFTLKGVLHLPDIKNPPIVVGSHGLEGSKESAKQKVLSTILVQNKIAFFRFDHRGCGESDGDFVKDTSLEKRTIDFIAAINHVLSMQKTSRNLAVFGSSMGGATCINAWNTITTMDINLCGAVLCSAPIISRSIENIPTQATGNRPALPLSFFRDNLLFNITDKAKELNNLLVFHGDADDIVPVSNAHDIYSQAKDPKQMIIHKNGNHQMTSPTDQIQFEMETIAWYLKCFSI